MFVSLGLFQKVCSCVFLQQGDKISLGAQQWTKNISWSKLTIKHSTLISYTLTLHVPTSEPTYLYRGGTFVPPSFWGLKRFFWIFYHIPLTTCIIWDCTEVFGPLPQNLAKWRPFWFSASFDEAKYRYIVLVSLKWP